jgi:hypothetical protein
LSGIVACTFAARENKFLFIASSKHSDFALIQIPRPGSFSDKSGVTTPLGQRTKRMSSSFGCELPSTIHLRSGSVLRLVRMPLVTRNI